MEKLAGLLNQYWNCVFESNKLVIVVTRQTLLDFNVFDPIKHLATIETGSEYHQLTFKNSNCIEFLNLIEPFSVTHRGIGKILAKWNNITIQSTYIKFQKVHPNAITPSKARFSDIGYDLSVIAKVKDFNDVTALYDTGIQLEIPLGKYCEVVARSSLSKTGYIVANGFGVIDPGYTGNIFIALTKVTQQAIPIEFPFRCCQLLVKNADYTCLEEIEEISRDTDRKDGGFGSTGN